MYAQVEKLKENKSRVVATSVSQQKREGKQVAGFVDNRPEALVKKKPEKKIEKSIIPVPERIQLQEIFGPSVQIVNRRLVNGVGNLRTAKVVQCCSVEEKSSLDDRWEQTELRLDVLYDMDKGATLPIVDKLEEIRSILAKDASLIDRGVLEGKIQWVEDWANATPENVMWDAYLDAYDERMRPRGTKGPVWVKWLQAFHNLESELYSAKENGGGLAYKGQRLQRFYSQLMSIGLTPPPEGPDLNTLAVNNILLAANARFQAFRTDVSLNRGAWAGSDLHGRQPGNYVQTNVEQLHTLIERNREGGGRISASWWLMRSDSAPSNYALHRGAVDGRGDFIYHL